MYQLANDENGLPIEVPATASGWLVRRHAGGRGRPGAVYDADGCPLVVPLDATGRELRQRGCAAGAYRLEAVDADRKPVGVVAFTEIARGQEDEEPVQAARAQHPDAAIEALARAVEAMQRTQAERERQQGQMFARLIERLAPVPVTPAQDMNAIPAQYVDLQRTLKRMGATTTAANVARDDAQALGLSNPVVEILDHPVVKSVQPLLNHLMWKWLGLTPEQRREFGAATGMPAPTPPPATSTAPQTKEPAPEAPIEIPEATPEQQVQLAALMKEFTDEEQVRLWTLLQAAPPEAADLAGQMMLSVPPKEAAAYLRARYLAANTEEK